MAKRRPASGLEEHLGYWLRFVSNHVSHAFRLKVEARGVTVAEWVLLRALFGQEGAHASQVAERLGMTRGAISKLVERLEQKELLSRQTTADDRRYQGLALTPAGEALVPDLARLADENDREFFGHLTPRQRTDIAGLLRAIVDRHGWKDVPVA